MDSKSTSYMAYDDDDEDEESDDEESELYSQLHYCRSTAEMSPAVEDSDHSDSDIITSGECLVSTSLDRSLCNLRNDSVSGGVQSDSSLSQEACSDLENTEVDLEEWMLLGGPDMEGDHNIQLNLEFGRINSGSEEEQQKKKKDVKDLWAINDKDKCMRTITSPVRYFSPGVFLPQFLHREKPVCTDCRETGHFARNCPYAKKHVFCCLLCGQTDHRPGLCPRRYCRVCGLPLTGARRPCHTHLGKLHSASQSLAPCPLLSFCSSHCQRCGLTGHLQEACPDLWRQYHLTTQPGPPKRPDQDAKNPRPKACYNCGRGRHYGHECIHRRMPDVSVSSLPYVCHYDTEEEILTRQTAPYDSMKGLLQMKVQKRTWPEKRRERREQKRRKREQAKELKVKGGCGSALAHGSPKGYRDTDPFPHPVAERKGGPRWMGRFSDRRKSGGRCGSNLYPPDSSASKGKAKRRHR